VGFWGHFLFVWAFVAGCIWWAFLAGQSLPLLRADDLALLM
jgi:hypothetical protein